MFSLEADELRGRAFGAMRFLRATAFRGGALASSLLALDRRRICRPSAQDKASWQGQTSTLVDGSSHLGSAGPMSQMGHKRPKPDVRATSVRPSISDMIFAVVANVEMGHEQKSDALLNQLVST